jgi:exopolyphosphatase/guanosine-5'-triphosphate,3'-diphosphate pyrophosphatase
MKSAPSFPERVASIDIGTNTFLLLIADVGEKGLTPLFEQETIVRLGEGVQKNNLLSQEAMERGLQTLTSYMEQCRKMEVHEVFAVGTSALRDATNSETFLKMTKGKIGLSIEIISGEEEAQLSFLAVTRDLNNPEQSILVVDVGGGSTEFILGGKGGITQWVSVPMGSVRYTERFLNSDPVREVEWTELEKEVQKFLTEVPRPHPPFSMVAVGGTATTLASVEQGLDRFVYEKIHHFVLRREALKSQLDLYRSRTIEERKKIPGLSPARADVILAGGAVLYQAMTNLDCPFVLVSAHGVRYGVLYKKISDLKFQISD